MYAGGWRLCLRCVCTALYAGGRGGCALFAGGVGGAGGAGGDALRAILFAGRAGRYVPRATLL